VSHSRAVRPLTVEDLEALTTPRLLAYRARLLELEDSRAGSDLNADELARLDPALLHFKDSPGWTELHGAVTAILSGREHVPRSP
jgi:hypothetical protein